MRKKTLVYTALTAVLALLIVFKIHQMTRPLYPDIVSLDDDRRNMAVARLQQAPTAKKEELRERLKLSLRDSDPRIRRYALYTLRKINLSDEKTPDIVALSFNDEDPSVREEAIGALLDAGEQGISTGVRLLANGRGVGAKAAATYFERLGPERMPELMAVLSVPSTMEGRRAAALTMVKMAPQSVQALPVFETILNNGFDSDVVKAVATMGPAAKPLAPLLKKFLKEGRDSLVNADAQRPLSARALAAVDPRPTGINNLSWDLKSKDAVVRYRAVYEWGQKPDLDVGAVPAMVNALRDPDVFVAARAAAVLVRLDLKNTEPMAKTAYPALKDLSRRVSEDRIEGFQAVAGSKIEALLQAVRR